jgi:glycolate oxidase FAD binding subunit
VTASSRVLAGDTGASPWQPLSPDEAASLIVDGLQPGFHAAPTSAEAVVLALRQAHRDGLAVAPRGGGTRLGLGNVPRRYDLALALDAVRGIVEYRPHDLVAVVLAGTPLTVLQEEFARHGQWLALDPPCAPASTLGGVLATNASGPHRFRYGTARDLVLGMQVAYAEGILARSGARVVKSVAGYDLHKLHVGALGTLGVIVEVAVRLHPLPASRRVLLCPVADMGVATQVVDALMRRPLALGAIEYLNAAAAHRLATLAGITLPGHDLLLFFCEGHPRAVARQADEVTHAAQQRSLTVDVLSEGEPAVALARAVAQLGTDRTGTNTVLKLTVPPGSTLLALEELAGILQRASAPSHDHASHWTGPLATETDPALTPMELHAHAGSGVVHAVATLPEPLIAPLVARARAAAGVRRGHLVVTSCPPLAKRGLDVWGPAGAPALMRGLKAALDPHQILNPGRFAEGL